MTSYSETRLGQEGQGIDNIRIEKGGSGMTPNLCHQEYFNRYRICKFWCFTLLQLSQGSEKFNHK